VQESGRPVALVLRALGLGDFATGLPALRAVRRAYADHELVLAAPAALAPLVAATGAVDRHLLTPSHTGSPVEGLPPLAAPPAVAVNLHGRGPQSTRALRALSPGRLLAFAAAGAPGPAWRAGEHEVARWCRLLEWYGIPADPGELALPAPGPADAVPAAAGAVLVHPGASGPERCWPAAGWAAVARELRAAGHRVLVTGSAAEVPLAGAVAAGAGLPPDAVLAGRTDLAALAWSVAHARLVLSGDTGIAHLATAYGTPSVVLFGPLPPAEWGPPPDRPRHVALWRGPGGLAGIPVADVLAAAGSALAAGLRSPLPGTRQR
jgi:ADP-heptose:LPS heptosyltransferase